MLFSEFSLEVKKPDATLPDASLIVESGPNDICIVDGLAALPLEAASRRFPHGQTVPVLDEANIQMGELLLCAQEEFVIPQFSAGYLAAYLAEVPANRYGERGFFSKNYLLVRADRLTQYEAEYKNGSAIWGGFQHVLPPDVAQVVTSNDPIKAAKNIHLSTDIHIEIARRAVAQVYAFERFLKLYHLLELSFDQGLVQEIQALGKDLKGIGKILSNYDSKEFHRLKQIIARCRRPDIVIECIRTLVVEPNWHKQIRTIFFEFGKEGNPIPPNSEDEFMALIATQGYTHEGMRPIAGIQKGTWTAVHQKKFEKFSLDLAAYCIYRIRSSIAHSRLGEYVMLAEDEPFVTFFAEPLLRCVLLEIL